MQIGCITYSSFNKEFDKNRGLTTNTTKVYMIYVREYFMFACVTVYLYINRLRDRYPEFYTTDIFDNSGITNYR